MNLDEVIAFLTSVGRGQRAEGLREARGVQPRPANAPLGSGTAARARDVVQRRKAYTEYVLANPDSYVSFEEWHRQTFNEPVPNVGQNPPVNE